MNYLWILADQAGLELQLSVLGPSGPVFHAIFKIIGLILEGILIESEDEPKANLHLTIK